ncbi:MAG: flagellar M-ring protein FliF [Actinobacteria bacterium]|nr:flagellar M-ring protein FliF [Actinomycetota bacterium]
MGIPVQGRLGGAEMALVPAEQINRYRENIGTRVKSIMDGFTTGQKTTVVAVALMIIIIAAIFMTYSGQPTYAPLFTNLSVSDAASMTAKLTSDHVPFQLANGGSTIMVPANDVASQRLALAQAGLPTQGNVGLSQVNKAGITTSQLAQQTDYLIGLQGELSNTIDAINGVTGSQVNIALPANQTFVLNNTNPTGASVLVDMAPGATLSPGEVQAIVHLVASSVPGLSASNVTVADSNGNLLAGPGVTSALGTEDSATQSYDQAEQAKIEAYLTSVLGPNNADVVVNAQLNFNQQSTTTHTLLSAPNGKVNGFCTSTSTSNEKFTGSGTIPGGALGSTVTPTTGTGATNYTKSSGTSNCEAGTQTQSTVTSPGQPVNQSVAVLVNSRALPAGVSLATLKAGVVNAAHVVAARGDTMSFASMPFSTVAANTAAKQAAAAAAATRKAALMNDIKLLAVALVILVVLFLLWRSARKARRASAEQELGIDGLLEYPEVPGALVGEPTSQLQTVGGELAGAPSVDMNQFIENQPDEVAATIRSWMREKKAANV